MSLSWPENLPVLGKTVQSKILAIPLNDTKYSTHQLLFLHKIKRMKIPVSQTYFSITYD